LRPGAFIRNGLTCGARALAWRVMPRGAGLRLVRAATLISLGMHLASCAAFASRPADPGMFLIPPRAAGRAISVTQTVRVERAGAPTFEVLAVVELDAHWLRVAALGPLGNRILLLEWDGSAYHEERDPQVPADFPLELVLRDLELALFPASAVREALPSRGWALEETPQRRVLFLDKKPVIAIDYSAQDHFRCNIEFRHLTLGYAIHIQPAEAE
jgi:uncharacterized protein DUF3261